MANQRPALDAAMSTSSYFGRHVRRASEAGRSGCGFDLRGGLLLIIFQRRNFHQGPLRIGAMHGLAVVPQSLLREPFRVADYLCAFPPRRSGSCAMSRR